MIFFAIFDNFRTIKNFGGIFDSFIIITYILSQSFLSPFRQVSKPHFLASRLCPNVVLLRNFFRLHAQHQFSAHDNHRSLSHLPTNIAILRKLFLHSGELCKCYLSPRSACLSLENPSKWTLVSLPLGISYNQRWRRTADDNTCNPSRRFCAISGAMYDWWSETWISNSWNHNFKRKVYRMNE